jgi:hypothetical protein
MNQTYLAVFIEWGLFMYKKEQFIGIYELQSEQIYSRHCKIIADHIGIKEFTIKAVASRINESSLSIGDESLDKFESEIEGLEIFLAPGILNQEEVNDIIDGASDALADQLQKANKLDSLSKEDADAIIKVTKHI